MTRRQALILQTAVREHIRTGEPVGSETLVARGRIPLSPATVRTEFVSLERAGLLVQPYTSAGRVPTVAGYRHYVNQCLERVRQRQVPENFESFDALSTERAESEAALIRRLAHTLADTANALAVVAAPESSMHEAGFGNLFQTPEFQEDPGGSEVERLLDVIEERGLEISMCAEDGPVVFIDGENPFARTERLSVIVTAPMLPSGLRAIAALIGPIRMPYDRSLRVMEALHRALHSHLER